MEGVRGRPYPAQGAPGTTSGPAAGSPTADPSLCLSAGRQPDANLLCLQNHFEGPDSGMEGLREMGRPMLLCVTSLVCPQKTVTAPCARRSATIHGMPVDEGEVPGDLGTP